MHFDAVISTPIGRIGLRLEGDRLVELDPWLDDATAEHPPETAAARRAVEAVRAFLADPRSEFDIEMAARGTPFQQRVWAALRAIPSGETRSYGELARELDSSPRAVGGACRANPILLLIPCHRVVSASGIGGFAGESGEGVKLALKRRLLALEGVG